MKEKESRDNEKSKNKTTSKNGLNLISNLQFLISNHQPLISNHKAITLIALIITIIVMLILVGVTINIALNGDLFDIAKNASKKTQFDADKESLFSAVIGAVDDNVQVDFEKLTENLPEGFTGNREDGYTSKSGNKFYVEKNGNITTEKPIEPIVPTVENYGDFVEYGVDLNHDGIYTNDWKVFYVDNGNDKYPDNDGKTFIIAADSVLGDECEALTEAVGESKANMTKNTSTGFEYCYYWESSSDAVYNCYDKHNEEIDNPRTSSKQQCSHIELFMAKDYYCSDHVGSDGTGGNANSRYASSLLCSQNWESFVKKDEGAEFAIGGPTIEMWVASWNQKHGDTDDTTKKLYCSGTSPNDYGYCIGTTENPTSTLINSNEYLGENQEGTDDTLYFPSRTCSFYSSPEVGDLTCCGYWLASPSAAGSVNMLKVTWSRAITYTSWRYYGDRAYALRPVVCIGTGVKLVSEE